MGAGRDSVGNRVMAPPMRYALIYGAIAGAIVISAIIATIIFGTEHSELVGYLIMLAALSLIFVGVKRYRDVECGGVIRFWRALGVGLAISAIAGVIYVAGWELYQANSGGDFMAGYTASVLADMRAAGASASKIAAKTAEMRGMAEMYANPLYRLPMVFMEIFPVGLIVSLISAAVLRNPRAFPRYRANA